jgi:flavorubredoxin
MSVKSNHHSAVMTELADCGAVLAGSPTHNNTVLPLVGAVLTYMKGLRPLNRIGGAFGSYGWSGESAKQLQEHLAAMNMEMPAEPVKCAWRPDKDALKACHALGKIVAEALRKKCA